MRGLQRESVTHRTWEDSGFRTVGGAVKVEVGGLCGTWLPRSGAPWTQEFTAQMGHLFRLLSQ